MSSANAFNLDQSRILSFGKDLRVKHYLMTCMILCREAFNPLSLGDVHT